MMNYSINQGPRLTIGMPVFNDIDYIDASIKSLQNQTFTDYILIISDDGSTDGSQQICRNYAAIDSRIKYIRQERNLGISKNMQFLLSQGKTEYFMWAGDDDLYDSTFIEQLILKLDNTEAVSAFCNFSTIDEKGQVIETYSSFIYNYAHSAIRLRNFIKNSHDAFGYGIFKTEKIRGVEFPVWWWPNKKSPYNNIYPTLCYYLAKGDYVHINGKPLFLKRVKTGKNVHHVLPGENNAIKESFAYWIRKFNLIVFSARMICKASNIGLVLEVLPSLFYFWFVVPSIKQFNIAITSFFRNKFIL